MSRRLPGSMMDNAQPAHDTRLAVRICLIAALVTSLLLAAVMYLPGETVLVASWVYFVAAALPIVCLLVALTLKLYGSIKSRTPRIIATIIAGFVVMVAITITYSLAVVYDQFGANPVAYYTNPDNGNRLVILRAVDLENDPEADVNPTMFIYGAYPMKDKWFYYVNRGDAVYTKTGIDYVEWTSDGRAALVHILDYDGVEQIITVSFTEPTESTAE